MKKEMVLVCGVKEEEYLLLAAELENAGMVSAYAAAAGDVMPLAGKFGPALCVADAEIISPGEWKKFWSIPAESRAPVIVVGGGSEEEELFHLRGGADDYISRPLFAASAAARARNILRRAERRRAERSVELGGLTLWPDAYRAAVGEENVSLIPSDFRLLCLFAENAGKVLSREQIINTIWGFDHAAAPRAVDTQIKRIRRVLREKGCGCSISSVYGVGYKLENLS